MSSVHVHDDTMSLLRRISEEALDPGYAVQAARRSAGAEVTRPSTSRGVLALALLTLGVLLAAAAIQAARSAPASAHTRAALLLRVQQATSATDRLAQSVTVQRVQVDQLRSAALTTRSSDLADQTIENALDPTQGLVAVVGPGLSLTMDDGPSTQDGTGPDLGRVLDRDLQSAVNGLWSCGAEAVAINGQRITTLSSVRSAGDAILVNYRPLTRPYVISAIGDPLSMPARFAASEDGQNLATVAATYSMTYELAPVARLVLPAASAAGLRYARATGSR
jgi:uncharacterized protein YlxW (UPF0749 family)